MKLVFTFFLFCFLAVLGIEPRASLMLGKCSFTELQFPAHVSLSVAVMDTLTWGGKGLSQLTVLHHNPSSQEVRTGTCRQELRQKPWRNIYWLTQPVSFLAQIRTTCPGIAPAMVGWTHPDQSLVPGQTLEGNLFVFDQIFCGLTFGLSRLLTIHLQVVKNLQGSCKLITSLLWTIFASSVSFVFCVLT